MSYKNAEVHNLHEPKTESKNRYTPFLFLSFSLCLDRFLSLYSADLSPSPPLFFLSLPALFSPGNAGHNG